jgi:KDO2-lipid IV(A) lauroyltransferase
VGHPLRYVIYLEDTILPEEYADRPDATQAITLRYAQALERLIRRHPEQYFWLHRRWKHQPPVRARRAA